MVSESLRDCGGRGHGPRVKNVLRVVDVHGTSERLLALAGRVLKQVPTVASDDDPATGVCSSSANQCGWPVGDLSFPLRHRGSVGLARRSLMGNARKASTGLSGGGGGKCHDDEIENTLLGPVVKHGRVTH